jgi:2-polyprenyl-6-hydroxyphenyl methylase/3-demethylubiquinone-9 3-methyltransferase
MKKQRKEKELERRFEFGKNWAKYLNVLDETRILEAETSLKRMLEINDLRNRRFLDIGWEVASFRLLPKD